MMKYVVAISSMIFFLGFGLFISEFISSRSIKNQSVKNNSVDKQIIENQAVDNKTDENSTVENQTVEKQTVENKTVENQATENKTNENQTVGGFSCDCDNTDSKPCRKLVANHQGKTIKIEPSGIAWSNRNKKAIVVNDNYNDLITQNAGHYSMVSFSLNSDLYPIAVEPLLTPTQGGNYPLYDLECSTLSGDKIYAISSLVLHGKNPNRDGWERHQFVQMDLINSNGNLKVANLSNVNNRWPDFRSWLSSKS